MSGPDVRSVKVVGFPLLRDDERRVLLARHTYGPEVWAMIGGMAEPGEAPDVTARREALEETGQTVATDRLHAVCDRGELLLFIFEGRVLDGKASVQADEIAELRWFTPDELSGMPHYPLVSQLVSGGPREPICGLIRIDESWPDGPSTPAYLAPFGP